MADILSITGPIFLIIGLGYAAGRAGIFARSDARSLGLFVLYVAMPALVIRALSQRSLGEILDARFIIGYATAAFLVFWLVFLIANRFWPERRARSAMVALGAAMSNSGFIGYPVAAMALGPIAPIALAHCMLIENFLLLPMALALAESGTAAGRPASMVAMETVKRLRSNPIILALIVGALLAAFGLKLPSILAKTVDILANASAAVSLFVIGATLVGVRTAGLLHGVSLVVIGKLVLHPLAVFAAVTILPSADATTRQAMLIFASVSMVTIYPILGQRYGEEEFCAAALLVTTVLAFFSVSATLFLIG